ncbi:hypothetical protein DL768_009425 [Monosporascus sp. mg162]|nr:hypothetical protein DL768_009425 [Monosporascus sp. mg162]
MVHRVILFGDQTVETLGAIRDLSKRSKKYPLLQRFLADANKVIKAEVQALGLDQQRRFFDFTNLVDLAEKYHSLGYPDDLVAAVLITIAQLGYLILHVGVDAAILNNPSSTVVGLCAGVLPAAVCALSKGLQDVLEMGVKMVSLAFHSAAALGRRSYAIENSKGYWGYTLINIPTSTIETTIEQFHRERGTPLHRRLYLSVVADSWATISGPPSLLEEFFAYSDVIGNRPKLRLPFGTAAHAPHLPPLELDQMVASSGFGDQPILSQSQLMSTSSCQPYQASTVADIFRDALADTAHFCLRLTDTAQGVLNEIAQNEDQVVLIPVGPLGHTPEFQKALQKAGKLVELRDLPDAQRGSHAESENGRRGDIAIVGMSGRFPGSETIEEFWKSLMDQKDFTTKVPASRFELSEHFDPKGEAKNSTTVPYGNLLSNPGLFDNRMFKVSPREALQMDPLQRISLMCTYEALEMAGYSPNRTVSETTSRIATFFGQAADDYRDNNINEGIDVYFFPSIQRSFVPGRLNYHFKWGGPSYSVDSACASSLSAVLLAMTHLLSNQCDMAVAGGGSLLTNPAIYSAMSKGSFLSPTGSCKTFQDAADGYCRGEGLGMVVMKRLRDAVADNDNILCVIRGGVRNYSSDSISITHPSTTVQQALYRELLHQTNLTPDQIGYVEMHGTATQAGDAAEMNSVSSVFGKDRPADYPLYVGAIKAGIGHGEAAAGVASLMKSILALNERTIPGQPIPSSGDFTLNRNYPPIYDMGIRVAQHHHEFKAPKSDGKRKVLINNFDAAGGNVGVILEEYLPSSEAQGGLQTKQDPRTHHVVAVSGHTAKAYEANKGNLLKYLGQHSEASLADLGYTTTSRRIHHSYRSAYVAESIEKLVAMMTQDTKAPAALKANSVHSVIFTFTGQGHKCITMGNQLYQGSSTFRRAIQSYHQLCQGYGFEWFLPLIQGTDVTKEADLSTVQTQLATVAVELALAELWREWGVTPSCVIGHSLGEYAALTVAGVLSVDDTLYLVGTRARLLQETAKKGTHAMLAIAMARDDVVAKLSGFPSCEVACINAPTATVVSGPSRDIEKLKDSLKSQGYHATRLDTPYAFHSVQVEPMLREFTDSTHNIRFAKPRIPVASTLLGELIAEDGIFNADYLVQQARKPVQFVRALAAIQSSGILKDNTCFVECGPHPVCLGFVKPVLRLTQDRLLPSLQGDQDDWRIMSLAASVLHVKQGCIDWTRFHQEHIGALNLLTLPSYAFDLKDYWVTFKSPRERPAQLDPATAPAQKKGIPSLLNSSIQNLESEKISTEEEVFTFSSMASERNLAKAMAGHVVDGHAICPTTVFLDMAMSGARYLVQRANPQAPFLSFSAHSLSITHPLVLVPSQEQHIFVTASRSPASNTVSVTFSSQTGSKRHTHGSCMVQAAAARQWRDEWRNSASLVNLAKRGLLAAAEARKGHRLSKAIAYQLLSQLVKYDKPYKCMEEVIVSDDFTQGISNLVLDPSSESDSFLYSPYWTDALVHLAGFQVNCNSAKPDHVIWLSAGLESLRIGEPLVPGRAYSNFVCFRGNGHDENAAVADVYIFGPDGETLVGIVIGLVFHRMDRSSFAALTKHVTPTSPRLSPSVDSKSQPPALPVPSSSAPVPKAAPTSASTLAQPLPSREGGCVPAVDESVHSAFSELEAILSAVAKQTGVDRSEIDDSTHFADLGVDSLMSITICDVLEKDLGISIPSAFFQQHSSVAKLREALGAVDSEEQAEEEEGNAETKSLDSTPDGYASPSSTTGRSNSSSEDVIDKKGLEPPKPDLSSYHSKVVLIQGRKTSKETPLFLLADGAGSASAYIHLPALAKGRPICALESPFLHDPEAFVCSVEDVSAMYLEALRKTQPRGPYLLGGWSAGAVFSYEVSRLLLEAGEDVLGLIMIDMRVPEPLPYHPTISMELLEVSGMTTGINRSHGGGAITAPIPLRLKQHLLSVCRALVKYHPQAMTSKKRPNKVFMVWARLGLSEVMEDKPASQAHYLDEKTKKWVFGDGDEKANTMKDVGAGMMAWFFARRTTFDSNGWDKLVGQQLHTYVVDADHFSMMAMPMVATTGKYIKDAVEATA